MKRNKMWVNISFQTLGQEDNTIITFQHQLYNFTNVEILVSILFGLFWQYRNIYKIEYVYVLEVWM